MNPINAFKPNRPASPRPFDVQGAPVPVGNPQAKPPELLFVDRAYRKDGQIFVEGWRSAELDLGLSADGEPLRTRQIPVDRPDVASNLGLPSSSGIGFVLIAYHEDGKAAIGLTWKDASGQQNCSQALTFTALPDRRARAGKGRQGRDVGSRLRRLDREQGISCCIDTALSLDDGWLLLDGWATASGTPDDPMRLELWQPGSPPIECDLIRYDRPDVKSRHPWLPAERLGFIALFTLAGSGPVHLLYTDGDGVPQSIPLNPGIAGPAELADLIKARWKLNTAIMGRVRKAFSGAEDDESGTAFDWARRKVFFNIHARVGTAIDNTKTGALVIDRAVPLGPEGILLYGWRHFVNGKVKAVRVHGPEGEACDIFDSFFPKPHADAAKSLAARYPDITESCGFICHVPLPTQAGDCRLLEIELDDESSQWLRIALPNGQLQGLPLIRDILESVEATDGMGPTLFTLFDRHIGAVIESVHARRPAFSGHIVERQFGTAPKSPGISVIVPLYGRHDFVRYQLSHFADDPDFPDIDLIYVIDDPDITALTNELATTYQPVFGLPFRTVSYGGNLGFAGANNVGVGVARGETVVLCNSDVLPQHVGWVGTLRRALETLPEAGAVGPLLQFADGSIQHAGMASKRSDRLPGFLLNGHPGKGQAWPGPDTPRECPMLTAACLMLRKQDYIEAGGLDEAYVVGDFEDGDLCLALRKRGKRLWLAPEAKLWHLERQSQNLGGIVGYRRLLTLYNGWRFQRKIRQGLIADPTQTIQPRD